MKRNEQYPDYVLSGVYKDPAHGLVVNLLTAACVLAALAAVFVAGFLLAAAYG